MTKVNKYALIGAAIYIALGFAKLAKAETVITDKVASPVALKDLKSAGKGWICSKKTDSASIRPRKVPGSKEIYSLTAQKDAETGEVFYECRYKVYDKTSKKWAASDSAE